MLWIHPVIAFDPSPYAVVEQLPQRISKRWLPDIRKEINRREWGHSRHFDSRDLHIVHTHTELVYGRQLHLYTTIVTIKNNKVNPHIYIVQERYSSRCQSAVNFADVAFILYSCWKLCILSEPFSYVLHQQIHKLIWKCIRVARVGTPNRSYTLDSRPISFPSMTSIFINLKLIFFSFFFPH